MSRRGKFLVLAALILVVGIFAAVALPGVVVSESDQIGGCAQRATSLSDAANDVNLAPPGEVVCLAAGSYRGALSLDARHQGDVTLQAVPGAHVATGKIAIGGSHLIVRDLWVDGEVAVEAGASHITIDHNDISQGGEGIVFLTSDCTAPNAPKWPGCAPLAPVTDVVISANHFHDIGQSGTEDAIHLDNWRDVTIEGNEFDHIIESGDHTDCLQSVYGGSGLIFTHNYEHDNDCQGFFVKDGDATDVSFTNNLFLRDEIGAYANLAQIWNVQGLTVEHNTIWDGKGLALVSEDPHISPSARVDHNLFSYFSLSSSTGKPYALTEGYDIFGHAPSSFVPSSSDRTIGTPRFLDPAEDDYRLGASSSDIGVDWSPAGQQYGPET